MNARIWRRGIVAALAFVTVAAAAPAAADEPDRRTGADGGQTAAGTSGDVAATTTMVALPDLAIAHRLPGGGMNLWRMPLSDLETGFAQPQLVRSLTTGGWSYDNSKTLAADLGDVTPSDDGTADHIIWHAQPNGGVLVWGVGGGGDTTPQLWQDLRTGGWSYAASTPMVADVTGDGWDDLVVVHNLTNGSFVTGANVWVFPNNGYRLSAPQLWGSIPHPPGRFMMADANNDGRADLVEIGYSLNWTTKAHDLSYMAYYNQGGSFAIGYYNVFQGATSAGWSAAASRQLAGDVNGDGFTDFVTVHAQSGGGLLVWVHLGCPGMSFCTQPPVIWQDLRTGGWSFAGSRQYLADTNGDGLDDLVTVHQQAGNPGELMWRHVSTGDGLLAPEVIADLRSGGWNYSASRDGVADTYGWATF